MMNHIFKLISVFTIFQLASGEFSLVQRGSKYSTNMKLYFQRKISGDPGPMLISPWHDIPLYNEDDVTNQTLNMVVEIPRFSQAKFEIHRENLLNPICQDIEDDKPRYLPNIYPWHGHFCNYGAFPQTWENPFHSDQWTGLLGDKDPIDVCEVGSTPIKTGSVVPVKVLGILAMLDSGETDWKVIVMNKEEAESLEIDDIDDLKNIRPEIPSAVYKFFRFYKVPAGKPENEFAYNGEVQDKSMAMEVINFTYDEWKKMILNCSITDTTAGSFNTYSPFNDNCKITNQQAKDEVNKQDPEGSDAPLPEDVDIWSYIGTSGVKSNNQHFVLILTLAIFMLVAYQ